MISHIRVIEIGLPLTDESVAILNTALTASSVSANFTPASIIFDLMCCGIITVSVYLYAPVSLFKQRP